MLRGCMLLGFGLSVLMAVGGCGSSKSGAIPFQEQVAEAQKETDVESRAKALIRIGYQQGKAKDLVGAEDTLRLAEKDCQSITDAAVQATALAMMADAYVSIGNRAAALKALEPALAAAAKIAEPESKARTLARVGQSQGAAKDTTAAAATLKSAEELAAKVDDVQGRVLVYCAVAGACHKFGQSDQRDRVFGVALEYAKSLDDIKKRSMVMAEVAAKQGELDQRKTAAKTFDLALATTAKIEEPFFRAYAMGDVAERLSKAGFHARAHEVLAQAERVAEKVPQQDMQMQAVQKIRSLMGKLPKPED
jgi:tetratricopeptide (TPR) repeat protein